MVVWNALKLGLKNSYKMLIKICKIIIPVYFVISLLDYTGILSYVSNWFSGIMKIFGLPGECALVLLLANCINIYAGIAAIGVTVLNVKQLTILGTMICLSHSLFMETSIIKGLSFPRYLQLIIRLGLSIIVGIIMNVVWVC